MKINAKQYVITKKPIEIDPFEISLLSGGEFNAFKYRIPPLFYNLWWLRSPGYSIFDTAYVDTNGSVDALGCDVDSGNVFVRPALYFKRIIGLIPGDKFQTKTKTWTVIDNNIAICDSFIGKYPFNKIKAIEQGDDYKFPNDYETSDIKKYIEDWWKTEIE